MTRQEYLDKKIEINDKINGYIERRRYIEQEYRIKMVNDQRWIRYGKLIDKFRNQIEEMGKLIELYGYYDDNGVYRTGERQLATRVDGSTMRREATLNTTVENPYPAMTNPTSTKI